MCDDYLHYWPSERCSTWHDGRELAPGQCCYPNTVDYYCSWMGVCSSDGSQCLCYDSQHRYNGDRCFNWYMDLPPTPIPPPPVVTPSVPVDVLSPVTANETCLSLTLVDNFGDGWKDVVLEASFRSAMDNSTNSTDLYFTVVGCDWGYMATGCLPVPYDNQSHVVLLTMRDPTINTTDPLPPPPSYFWELQWSAEMIIGGVPTGEKSFGGFDTSLEFVYDPTTSVYTLSWWDEMWVYPEEEAVCGELDPIGDCNLYNMTVFSCGNSTVNGTNVTSGGNYEEAGWYISSLSSDYTAVNGYGIPWSSAASLTSTSSCSSCLGEGSYVFEVTGANFPDAECIHWSFCGVEGGAQERVYFNIINGSCSVISRTDLDDVCPQGTCPPFVTSAPTPVTPPTASPPTAGPPTAGPPTPGPPTANPPTVHPPTSTTASPTPTPGPNTIPDILAVTPGSWHVTSSNLPLTLEVTTTPYGGNVYCAAYIQGTAPSNSYDIIAEGFGVSTPSNAQTSSFSTLVHIELFGLVPHNHYDIWCIAQDTLGNTDPLSEAFKLFSLWVEYCKTTTLLPSPTGYALSATSAYASLTPSQIQQLLITFTLDFSPRASLIVTPVVYQGSTRRSDVIAHPSSFTFTSTDMGGDLSGSFYLTGPAGSYTVKLEYASTGYGNEYCGTASVSVTTINGGLADIPAILPALQSAQIEKTGQKLVLVFDKATDFASSVVTTDTWDCSLVVTFPGADSSLCYWRNDRTIVAILPPQDGSSRRRLTGVAPGDTVTSLEGVLKGVCLKTSCASDPFAPASSVIITVSPDHVTGTAVLVAPSVSLVCLDLVLDPSMSTNHGGRAWQTVSWVVLAEDGSDVSALQTLLNTVQSTDLPVTIPSSLLHVTNYYFSLGVRNYMEPSISDMTYTTVKVSVLAEGPVVAVSFAAPPLVQVEVSSVLIVDATALVLDCVPTGIYTYSYTWSVTQDGVATSITSTSTNPASFSTLGNVFDLSSVYTLTLVVQATTTGGQVITATRSVTVYPTQTYVTARVGGGMTALSLMTTEGITLDGSESVGVGLAYHWTCQFTNAATFGTPCGLSSSASSTLTIPPSTFTAGATVLISLTVNADSLSSSATVSVSVVAFHADLAVITLDPPSVPQPFNPVDTLKVFSTITSSASGGADATWDVLNSFLSLPTAALTSLSQSLTHTALANGIAYPLGIRPFSLTGGKTYTFELLVTQTVGQKFIAVGVQINSPPSGGSLVVTPSTGTAYDDAFTFSAPRWVDDADSLPLRYQFVYQIAPVFDWSSAYARASAMRTFTYKTTQLPAGHASAGNALAAGVIVRDVFGSDAWGMDMVTVAPSVRRKLSNSQTVQSALSSLQQSLATFDLSAITAAYQLSVNLLNDATRPDCSLAPDCAALNRDICSATAQTCGSCLTGYSGVYGDSNYGCHASADTKKDLGESCAANSDCYYNSCVNAKCTAPVKVCPLGEGGAECSGHGTCDYATGQGTELLATGCTVEDTTCIASCVCEAGWGGAVCGFTSAEVSVISAQRGEMCTSLVTMTSLIQPTKEKLETFSDYLVQVFDATGVLEGSDLDECNAALSSLSASLSAATVNTGRSNGQVANVISEFTSHAAEPAPSAILEAVEALEEYAHTDMLPGQEVVSYTTPNFRVGYYFPSLALLTTENVMEAPRTAEEVAYDVDAYSVNLPAVGLNMCGAFEDFALITLTVWAQSPYDMGDAALDGNLFAMSTFSTGGTGDNVDGVGDAYQYRAVLHLNGAIDLTQSQPDCREYFFATGVTQQCASCLVDDYTTKSAQITCSDAVDYFCPVTGVSRRASQVSRQLQTAREKSYSLGVVPAELSAKGEGIDEVTESKGIFAFIVVFLCCVFGSLFLLHIWDRSDRRDFIAVAAANHSRAASSKDFNLSAAFDDGGQKSGETINVAAVAKVAADLRASSFSHSITGSRSSKFSFFNPSGSSSVDKAGNPIPSLSPTSQSVLSGEDDVGESGTEMVTRKKAHSEHVVNLDTLAGRRGLDPSPSSQHPDNQAAAALSADNLVWSNLPPSSLLSDHDWFTRVSHAFGRHHKWARIFTYPSMRRSRLIRFLVAASDLMFVIFVNTVFYSVFYPDDNTCQDHSFTSPEKCLADDGKFDPSESLCQWHSNGDCTLREPPFNVRFIVSVTMIVIVFAAIPRSIMQFLLEKICARRPAMEDVGLKPQDFLQAEPAPASGSHGDSLTEKTAFEINNPSMGKGPRAGMTAADVEPYALAQCDHMNAKDEVNLLVNTAKDYMSSSSRSSAGAPMVFMMDAMRHGLSLQQGGSWKPLTWRQYALFGTPEKHIQWKVAKAREESVVLVDKAVGTASAGPDQFEWTDMVVMQHFIMEQLSPITRFCLKKSVFEMDHATPGRIGFFPWVAGWAVVLGCWGFMSYWIIHWTLTNGAGPARAWGLVLGIVLIADTIMNQLTQIYFLNVLMTDKLRPQLREIFGVLNDCLHMRLLKRVSPFDGARVVQHMSAACRAGRSPGVSENICAYVLALVDDIDVYLCRRHRLETLREVGIIAWATLFHPALLNGTYDLLQQTVMDLIIPVAWCCFILLNYAVTLVSIYFLIALWIVGVVGMVLFYYWNTSLSTSHAYTNITGDVDEEKVSRGHRITANEDMTVIYRDSCLEQSSGTSPLATDTAVVEMVGVSTKDVLLGEEETQEGGGVFAHNSDEIIVAEESDTLL